MRPLVAILALGAFLSAACQASDAASPGAPHTVTPTPTQTVPAPTASPSPSPTPVPAVTHEPEALEPVPTPTLFSEVLGETEPPLPPPVTLVPVLTPVPGGMSLPLPDGTTVVWGGCSTDGECHWFNFYWAPTREAVMQEGESPLKVQHELCHAHQHWSINGGAPLNPADYNLEVWYSTPEGASFLAAVEGLAWPWSQSAVNGLEDFAWVCAYWHLQPDYLLTASPERYAWAAANLR